MCLGHPIGYRMAFCSTCAKVATTHAREDPELVGVPWVCRCDEPKRVMMEEDGSLGGGYVKGTRRPDETPPYELEPGDYCLRKGVAWVRLPDGTGPRGLGTWTATWHEDGTLTLSPSIQDIPTDGSKGWHGFLERGVWREV